MIKNYKKYLWKWSIPILMTTVGPVFSQTSINLAGSGNRTETTANLDVVNGFTIEYDLYMNVLKDYNGLVTKGCSNVGAPIDAYIKSNGVMTVFYGNCSITGGGDASYSFSANTWYHITHTYDPIAGQGLLYVNGSLETTWSVGSGLGNGTVPLMIGNRADNVTDADAQFDNVRIWSGVRSAADILTYKDICLTGSEAGLEILYNMEEGTGTTLHDLATGNGTQDGSIIGTITWGTGLNCTANVGAALNFDGSNDDILPTSTTNIPLGNSPYTIEAWIKPNSSGATSALGIVGWGSYGGGNQVNAFRTTSQGGLDNYWWGNDLVVSPTGFNLFDGNWHHVATTYDGVTRIIYVDGIARGMDTPSGHNVSTANNMTVGKTCCSEYYSGSMDEVRIWNIARTQCQISNGMNCELTGTQTNLALYYQFNQGLASAPNATVNVAMDASGNNNNGTLTNFALNSSVSNWITPSAIPSGVSCGASAGITISVNTATVCAGSAATLTASGATTYTWSTTETTSSITPSPTVSTVYTVTGTAATGCSGTNTTTIMVTALPNVSISGVSSLCSGSATTLTATGGDSYVWLNGSSTATNSIAPTTNTTYTVIGTNTLTGCSDSAFQTITTKAISLSSHTLTVCAGQSIAIGTHTYTTTGIYTDVLTAVNGCDSTVTTNLTVLPVNATSHSVMVCAGHSTTVGTHTYTATGTYTDVLTAVNGCDSSVTTNLSVLPVNATSHSITICAGQSTSVGSHTYTATGTYTDVLTAVTGCDSTVTTNLIVNPVINIATTLNGQIITANATGASYQWVDCNNANVAIIGQTNQSYTATSNGSYAVIVTENMCSNTSTCIAIVTTGIVQQPTNILTVFPNPNTGMFTLKSTAACIYTIVNELGQTVRIVSLTAVNNYQLTIDHLDNGIYFIISNNPHSILNQKIVVTK